LVVLKVVIQLLSPEFCAGFRPFEQTTSMPVPKTAMNKNNGSVLPQYNIRLAGKLFVV
jgi:hypothetical protein